MDFGFNNRETRIAYLLNPWSRVLLEKLTGLQLVKKFPAFCGTRRFVTVFISAHHLPYPEPARSSPYSHIPLPEDLAPGSPQWSLSLRFPHQNSLNASPFPIRATCPTHLIHLDFIIRKILGEEYRSLSSSLCSFLRSPVTSSLLGPKR